MSTKKKYVGPLYFLMATVKDDWGNVMECRVGGMRKNKKRALRAAKEQNAALYQYPGRQLVWHPIMEGG